MVFWLYVHKIIKYEYISLHCDENWKLDISQHNILKSHSKTNNTKKLLQTACCKIAARHLKTRIDLVDPVQAQRTSFYSTSGRLSN